MKGVGVSVIVVTEAAAPRGQALAEAFARPGVALILADRDTHALKSVAARCRDMGAEAAIVEGDICDTASARKLVNAVREIAGQVDVWISQTVRGYDGITPDIPAAIAIFMKQKRGTLIHLVSGAVLPAGLRAPLSAHRRIHLCDVHAGDLECGRLARAVAELARAPRPMVRFGANDNMFERILKVGTAVGLATLTGLGGLVSTLESARMG